MEVTMSAPAQTSFLPLHLGKRRTFRFAEPGQQLRLSLGILAVSLAFYLLFVGNSYAAYFGMFRAIFSTAPIMMGEDLEVQTAHYIRVTTMLVAAYSLAVVGLSVAFVHRITGPIVALERHARALKSGKYSSRVALRSGREVHAELARQLNELATSLEQRSEPPRPRGDHNETA